MGKPTGFMEIKRQTSMEPVSYTHLDVYKRQGLQRLIGTAGKLRRFGGKGEHEGAGDALADRAAQYLSLIHISALPKCSIIHKVLSALLA